MKMTQDARAPDDLRERLSAWLESRIVHADSIINAFIPFGDIQAVWSGDDTIRKVLHPAELSLDDVVLVRQQLLKTLSILVYIHASSCLIKIGETWSNRDETIKFTDANLPAAKESLTWIENARVRQRFYDAQFIFAPVSISLNKTLKTFYF
jgi:hypothetical protein